MGPTRPATLAIAGIIGVVVGVTLGGLSDRLGYGLPRVSWVSIGLLLFLAALLLVAARRVRRWVSGDRPPGPGDALTMGRLVALAKAGSIFGAVMAGGYLGLAAAGLDRVASEYGREHVGWATGGAVAGIAVLVAAIILERVCRLPGDGEGLGRGDPALDGSGAG
jgi:hypothetical protein